MKVKVFSKTAMEKKYSLKKHKEIIYVESKHILPFVKVPQCPHRANKMTKSGSPWGQFGNAQKFPIFA